MDSIINSFHLDVRAILAQLVNFAVVALALGYLVFKPLAAKMAERSKTIEKSLEEAKSISKNFEKSEVEKQEILHQAREEAKIIVKKSKEFSQQENTKSLEKTKLEIEKLLEEKHESLLDLKDQIIKQSQEEMAELVMIASAKVLEQNLDEKIDKKLVKKVISEIKR